jgi:hypothetical protein
MEMGYDQGPYTRVNASKFRNVRFRNGSAQPR